MLTFEKTRKVTKVQLLWVSRSRPDFRSVKIGLLENVFNKTVFTFGFSKTQLAERETVSLTSFGQVCIRIVVCGAAGATLAGDLAPGGSVWRRRRQSDWIVGSG